MVWWLMFVFLVVAPLAWRGSRRQRALPEHRFPALANAIVGLAERLGGVDAAIDGVRSVLELANPSTAQACAATAVRRRAQPGSGLDGALGPGTARFEQLLATLAAIDADDLRDLADVGLDPAKIVAALAAPHGPEQWRRQLLDALDYWQQGTTNLRARRYG